MDEKKKWDQLIKITNKRLRDEGWENVTQFTRDSGIEYTMETVRRAFIPLTDKGISPDVLAIILFKLNFSVQETKELIEKYTDTSRKDRFLWHRMGDDQIVLSSDQQAILNATDKILKGRPELRAKIADTLSLLACVAQVDIEAELKCLQRKQKRA